MANLSTLLHNVRCGIQLTDIHADEHDIQAIKEDLKYLNKKLDEIYDVLHRSEYDKTLSLFEATFGLKPVINNRFKNLLHNIFRK